TRFSRDWSSDVCSSDLPVLRYPMGKLVVGGSLTYGKQQFTVAQTLPNNQPTDIPSVEYTMFTPTAFLKYPLTSKINVNADASFQIGRASCRDRTDTAGW